MFDLSTNPIIFSVKTKTYSGACTCLYRNLCSWVLHSYPTQKFKNYLQREHVLLPTGPCLSVHSPSTDSTDTTVLLQPVFLIVGPPHTRPRVAASLGRVRRVGSGGGVSGEVAVLAPDVGPRILVGTRSCERCPVEVVEPPGLYRGVRPVEMVQEGDVDRREAIVHHRPPETGTPVDTNVPLFTLPLFTKPQVTHTLITVHSYITLLRPQLLSSLFYSFTGKRIVRQ